MVLQKTYVNTEAGLLFQALMYIPKMTMDRCIGKSVSVENLELNALLVDGRYFEIIGYYGTLKEVVEVTEVQVYGKGPRNSIFQ